MSSLFLLSSSGYIGRNLSFLARRDSGAEFKSAGRSGCDYEVDLDSGRYDELLKSVKTGDFVVFLAAVSAPDICAKQPELAWRVNVRNTLSLIDKLSRKGVHIIFASSDVVFGKNTNLSSDNASLQPSSAYGEMKAEVEKAVFDNQLVKVIRFSLVVGREDKFSDMLKSAASEGKAVDIFAGFERNIVSIDDVVAGILRLIQSWDEFDEQVFNFSGPELVSREDLTAALAQVIPGINYTVTEAPSGFWDNRERVIETGCQNFTRLLGRKPKNLEQIISEWVN